MAQDVSGTTPIDENNSANNQIAGSTLQDVSGSTPLDVSGSTPQDVSGSTPSDVIPAISTTPASFTPVSTPRASINAGATGSLASMVFKPIITEPNKPAAVPPTPAAGGGPPPGPGDSEEELPLPVSRGKIPPKSTKWHDQPQYILFSNEIKNIKKSNMIILKECKEAKRLLDLKYGDLEGRINVIQTSVIIFSTISGFFNATKVQFGLQDAIISVMSIIVSTYVSLILSVSKYFKYDETKESIQNLREKYSMLHNQIEHRMDVLGPWHDPNLWKYADPDIKLTEWDQVKANMDKEYDEIIVTKQKLTTQFEITMDTKSRNAYHINNRQLTYDNRVKLFEWAQKEMNLDDVIDDAYIEHEKKKSAKNKSKLVRRHTLHSEHEIMSDNWDEYDDDNNEDDKV